MTETVMLDGRIVSGDAARVSVFDRGFLYGDSVFESLRTYRGVPFALEAHLERLARSAERVLIDMPVRLSALKDEVLAAVGAHGVESAHLRVMLTRGIGENLGLDPVLARAPRRVVLLRAFPPVAADVYGRGVSAVIHRAERPNDAAGVSAAKVGNYLVAVLAQHAARARGASEALVADARGFVLEGATSNLFAVFGDTLCTAPDSSPILAGITRRHVIALAREAGTKLELREIHESELLRARELFVCSSLRELVPVVRLEQTRIGDGTPGPVTTELMHRYESRVLASTR